MTFAPTSRASSLLAKTLLVALLATPALLKLSPSQGGENRNLAPMPDTPATLDAALHYTAALDAWFNDHFRMREALVTLNTKIRYALFRQFPTNQVIAGREGRTFMATYNPKDAPFNGVLSACGYQLPSPRDIGDQINRLMAMTSAQGVNLKLLVVPSSPVVNIDQLPEWLSALCHQSVTPMTQLTSLPMLTAAARQSVYYPLDEMRIASHQVDMFPRNSFHWGGAGPRMVSDWAVKQFWNTEAQAATSFVSAPEWRPSDLSHMFPGVALGADVETLNLPASGIEVCFGSGCFGDMQPVLAKFGEMALYHNPKAARGKLLLLTDSFGPPAASWFSRYYKEVALINLNSMDQLKEPDLARMRKFIFQDHAGDDMLLLYHDVTVHASRIRQDFSLLLPGF